MVTSELTGLPGAFDIYVQANSSAAVLVVPQNFTVVSEDLTQVNGIQLTTYDDDMFYISVQVSQNYDDRGRMGLLLDDYFSSGGFTVDEGSFCFQIDACSVMSFWGWPSKVSSALHYIQFGSFIITGVPYNNSLITEVYYPPEGYVPGSTENATNAGSSVIIIYYSGGGSSTGFDILFFVGVAAIALGCLCCVCCTECFAAIFCLRKIEPYTHKLFSEQYAAKKKPRRCSCSRKSKE